MNMVPLFWQLPICLTFRISFEGLSSYDHRVRTFVRYVEYQSTRADSKGLFALDNLWDGLGALTVVMPNVKYFFGKVTMYPSYHRQSRDKILYFLRKHFADKDNLITPMKPLLLESDENELDALFCKDSFKEDYKILNCEIRKAGYNIPRW